jgi:hypothetical protein
MTRTKTTMIARTWTYRTGAVPWMESLMVQIKKTTSSRQVIELGNCGAADSDEAGSRCSAFSLTLFSYRDNWLLPAAMPLVSLCVRPIEDIQGSVSSN